MRDILAAALVFCLVAQDVPAQRGVPSPPNVALTNGKWFNGRSFERRTMFSVGSVFTETPPARLDRTIDLGGAWIVPPFAEAHNHNLGTGIDARDTKAIRKYIEDGVFYVKIQGNLPVTAEWKAEHFLNRPDGLDAIFAQGSQTATGGHPIQLVEMLLHQGYYPGNSIESLEDNRYFKIDSAADLDRAWPLILRQGADFIKVFLWNSDEFEKRKLGNIAFGQKGLDPQLVPMIVHLARERNLRVSAHIATAADFHNALAAGVDEITHVPISVERIADADLKLAALQRTTVITTCSTLKILPRAIIPEASLPQIGRMQTVNLKLLAEHDVRLAIGSDNVSDSSLGEFEYLDKMAVFDKLSLVRMWTEATPKAIFPDRRIGELREGFEASFLALEGNPLENAENVRRIRLRFKQGQVLNPNSSAPIEK